jgi:hypothetical protein
MEFKNFLQSSKSKHVVAGIGIAVTALLIFQAGVFVGFRKAGFAGRMGDNYYKTFGERRDSQNPFPSFGMREMMDPLNSHGTIGKIVSVALPEVIVADRDGIEKIILVDSKTDIRQFRDTIKAEQLKTGDFVTIIGEPNDKGQIEARLIRVMPTPPDRVFEKNSASSTKTN